MRNAKSKFFHDNINDCSRSNYPKEAWRLINTLLGKYNKPNNLSELSVNDNLLSDLKSTAEALNDYFVNIGPTGFSAVRKPLFFGKIFCKVIILKSNVPKKIIIVIKNTKLLCGKINVHRAALHGTFFNIFLLLEVRGRMTKLRCTSFLVETILGSPLFWL